MFLNIFVSSVLINSVAGHHILSMLKDKGDLSLENVNDVCAQQMNATLKGLFDFDEWAMSLVDASSRIPTGLLGGNFIDFGHFDQCVGIRYETEAITIQGKHCAMGLMIPINLMANLYDTPVTIHHPKYQVMNQHSPFQEQQQSLSIMLSMCIPDGCKPSEVHEYFNITTGLVFNDGMCQTNDPPKFDGGDIAMITFLSFILFLMTTSTLYDIYLHQRNQRAPSPTYLAFSALTNGKRLLTVSTNEYQISCINGIRFISMMWVVAGHRFAMFEQLPVTNRVDVITWMGKIHSQYIQSAHVAVDTFFFMSGMMIAYGYFKSVHKPRSKTFVPIYYFHRLLRITPPVAVIFFVSITILRHIGNGPLWPIMTSFSRDPCIKWWWTFFLYIQNYVNYDDLCIVPTWYLSADTQMFFLSPLVLLPLGYVTVWKSRDITYLLCYIIIAAFVLVPFTISFFVETENIYMTHERLAVWMLGFTTGIILEDVKTNNLKVYMNSVLNIFIWIIVISGMVAILLTMHDVTYNPTTAKTNIFTAYHRLGWGLGLGWIIYSCTTGYGGFVNRFLSYSAFEILARLTYSMYLVHFLVIVVSVGQERRPFYFRDYSTFYLWCGDIICTTLLAIVWVLAFESPVLVLEKLIFGGGNRVKKSNQNVTDGGIPNSVPETKTA